LFNGDVHRSQLAGDLGDECIDGRGIGDIALLGNDLRAKRTAFRGDLVQLLHFRARAQREIGAFARERDRGKLAHVAARAGDEYGLAFQACVHAGPIEKGSAVLYCVRHGRAAPPQ
jgi:hypothetical protein